MNAQLKIKPACPLARAEAKQRALDDLQAEFSARWQSLVAEFSARKARIEREFW